jgi:glutathione S-transferase
LEAARERPAAASRTPRCLPRFGCAQRSLGSESARARCENSRSSRNWDAASADRRGGALWHAQEPESLAVITLYHARFSRSVRVRWLLEELGLPHHLMTLAIDEVAEPEHVALQPLGRVPVLVDGELVLQESGAIVQYLLDTYGHGRLEPARGSGDRPRFLQWFHFAEATLAQPLASLAEHTWRRPPKQRIPELVPDARAKATRALTAVERALSGREWLTREFSAADIMMGWSTAVAARFQLVTREFPSVRDYVARCHRRPPFRRSMYS